MFAEQRLAALESEISVVEMQEYIALSRLSQLMGRPVVLAELTAAPSPSPRVDEELTELLRRAETVSPVLKRYQAQVEEQDAVIRERKSEMWPEAYARLEWQYGSFSVKGSDPETRVFVGLKSHFGAGLSNRSAISEAVSQRNALVAEIEIQKRTINEQIMTDFATLRSVSQREKALVTARERARVVMDSWDRQFLSGRKSWQDVMNSVRELVQLEVQFSDLSAMRLVSSWRIRLAVEDGVKEKGSHD